MSAVTVNGIAEGESCWLVRANQPARPIECPNAVILSVGGQPHVWHDGLVYDEREVFASKPAAMLAAYQSALWYRDHFASQSSRFAAVVADLKGEVQ